MEKDTLVIVGNGFDRHHKLDTGYKHYRKFLAENGHEDVIEKFERNECDDFDKDFLWNRMESVIGLLSYENAYVYLKGYGDDDWSDSYHHDFQYEVKRLSEYWPEIKIYLNDWIKSIKYTNSKENLMKLFKGNCEFISFNYTSTLEMLYDIDCKKIFYIHGNANRDEELVLGHANISYYPEWDDNEDTDVRLLEAGQFMEEFRKKTLKRTDEIIKENVDYFMSLKDIKRIYVLGLSYNEIDMPYLKELSQMCQNAEWYFSWYSVDDLNSISNYAEKIGVTKYTQIKIEEL